MELPLEKAPIWKWLSVLGGVTQQSTPWVPPALQGLELALLFSPQIIVGCLASPSVGFCGAFHPGRLSHGLEEDALASGSNSVSPLL